MLRALLLLLLAGFCVSPLLARDATPAAIIASLCDPVKLATLQTPRAANPRILKTVYWLETARTAGADPVLVVFTAMQSIGWANTAKGSLTADAILRNRTIADRLGCLNPEGMERMRHGQCPIVVRGPFAGQILSVDHIIPRAVRPDLDNVIANLEPLPLLLNIQKSDKIGPRQTDLETQFQAAGL